MKSYDQLPEIIQSMKAGRSDQAGTIDQLITIYARIARKSSQGNHKYSFS